MSNRFLIIDFDSYIYKALTASKTLIEVDKRNLLYSEGYDLKKGLKFLQDTINRLCRELGANQYELVIGDKNNFRKKLYPDYKSNRPEKPEIFYKLLSTVKSVYQLTSLANLEGDDACRIIYEDNNYKGDYEKIIVSVDKDFYSVPCRFYRDLNRPNKQVEVISVTDARKHLMKQIITGDRTDGYSGIPDWGDVKADKFITDETTQDDVLQLFLDNGLTEDDYIKQRTLARTVNITDYNMQTGEVTITDDTLI